MSQQTPLPAWWHIMPPHHDIRTTNRLDESIFAADLGQVVRGEAPYDYQDPVRFFAGTFLSVGLAGLLGDVLRELAGSGSGNRIIQIETPFGGGKTHTLLALYHLIHNAAALAERPETQKLLRDNTLTGLPGARVATIAGSDLAADHPEKYPDGTSVHTLWGQLAYQLGGAAGYARLRSADEARAAPGANALRDLFATVPPRLILIDELVNYIVSAAAVAVGGTTLKDQTITFLQQLTQAVAQTPQTVLLLTIPGSKTELYGQAAKEMQQQLFEAASHVGDVVGRVQTVRTPVQGDDIYEVLRRRLFDPLIGASAYDERDTKARAVATAFVDMYRNLGNDVPQDVQERAYIDRMVRAYPFHPDVVRVLYERWGTLPDFQRTRGALRILGMVLADLFSTNTNDPLILPCHLNLAPGDLRNELVRVLDNNTGLNNVLDSDVAGSNAKAAAIDMGLGREHARFQPATRVATTIFLWSFSGSADETRGANEAQLRVGTLLPTMQPAIVGVVLGELRRQLWYLHEENNTYRFDTRANLNRVIVQKEESVTTAAARKLVEETIKTQASSVTRNGGGGNGGLFGGDGASPQVRSYLFPRTTQDVADIALLGVVLLRPNQHAPAGEHLDDLPPFVREVLHQYGTRPRENRNALVVLVPDTALVSEAEKAARRRLALKAALDDSQLALPDKQRHELQDMLKTAEDTFPQEVARIYRSVVIPAGASEGGMLRFDMGTRASVKGNTLWDDAFGLLAARDKYLTKLSPTLLTSETLGVWAGNADYMSTQKLWESFVQFPHLPLLAGQQVLLTTIAEGCTQGVVGYAIGDDSGPLSAEQARFGDHNAHLPIELAPTTWVVRASYARSNLLARPDPVRAIPATLLTDPAIWTSGGSRRRLSDVWDAVVNHYAPRPVDGLHVLGAALHEAVAQNLVQVAVGDNAPAADVPALADAAALATVELVRPVAQADAPVRMLTIDVPGVDLTQLSKIATGVIRPLQEGGATVTLRLVIDAEHAVGIDRTVLELTVKETLQQMGLAAEYQQSG